MLSALSDGGDSRSAAKELALIQVSDSGTGEASAGECGDRPLVPARNSKWYLLRREVRRW